MPKASPVRNTFQGELSELAQGRTDIDRYAKSMRYMNNFIAHRIGPAIRRSGTTFEGTVIDESKTSTLLPFIFNELEVAVMEFGRQKIRFWYEYIGLAAHREFAVTNVVTLNPLKLTIPNHDYVVGESAIFTGFPGAANINGVAMAVNAVAGNDVTFSGLSNGATGAPGASAVAAIIYEVATPYLETDVERIRVVQYLDTVYVFCDNYPQYVLKRFDTYDWTFTLLPVGDGPYLDINPHVTTRLIPTAKGSWVADMTANNAPSGLAAADSEVAGHEAYKAFDGDLTSFWEGTTAQEGYLDYSFVNGDLSNKIPTMTGATTSGTTMSATSEVATLEAWRASDGDPHSDWLSSGNVPQWIKIDFGASPQTILQYAIRASRKRKDNIPKDWTFEGSNDNIAWTVLNTRVGVDFDTGQKRHFNVTVSGLYRYYRINVTKVTRHRTTTKIPRVGTPGKPGFVKAHTVTTLSAPTVAIASINLLGVSGVPRIVNGYTIHIGMKNSDDAASAKEHAPSTWTFEGWDGVAWFVLDSQRDYDDWGSHRSSYFDIKNDNPYHTYRLNIKELKKNGSTIMPRIGTLAFSSPDAPDVAFTASGLKGINDDRGFQPTDVGRIMRLKDADNFWRWGTITSVTDEVHATFNVSGKEPLLLPKQVSYWRLGIWSATTGYPACGVIWEDRLWQAGMVRFPDSIVASRTGRFDDYQTSTTKDEQLDDSAMIVRCNNKRMSRIQWLSADENSVIAGTGTGEFILTSPNDAPLTARNVAARPITTKGSAVMDSAAVDSETLMVQRSGRALYAIGAKSSTEAGGTYTATPITLLGSHLAFPLVTQITYSAEPHSVVWARRTDGSVISMVYDKVLDITGGQRHDFGGVVESLCVVPSPVDVQDTLYMIVKRTINGLTRRYVERLSRYWDFGLELVGDALFLDCALTYFQTPQTVFTGLKHLALEHVDVLADGIAYRDMIVTVNGTLTLPLAAQYVVIGKQYTSEAEITNLEEGAADGTAQGKAKRPHNVSIRLWDTYGGDVGRWNTDMEVSEWTPIEYPEPSADLEPATLRTLTTEAMVLPQGYGNQGTVRFRQEDPYPFNVVALYPQIYVNDR